MLRAPLVLLLAVLANPPVPSDMVVPDFADLTIKTRTAMDERHTIETTWFFKGARQRMETRDPAAKRAAYPSITQCDQGIRYLLNEDAKTYNSMPIDPAEMLKQWRKAGKRAPKIEMSGGELTVTIDAVDSGERRSYGSFEARHVKTTITAEPGPGAVSRPSKTEVEGWYLDLPGLHCRDSNSKAMGWSTAWSGRQDRIVFKQLGTARRGLPLEETTTRTEAGRTSVIRTEFLEISEQALDPSLFELPADYSPARREPDKLTPVP